MMREKNQHDFSLLYIFLWSFQRSVSVLQKMNISFLILFNVHIARSKSKKTGTEACIAAVPFQLFSKRIRKTEQGGALTAQYDCEHMWTLHILRVHAMHWFLVIKWKKKSKKNCIGNLTKRTSISIKQRVDARENERYKNPQKENILTVFVYFTSFVLQYESKPSPLTGSCEHQSPAKEAQTNAFFSWAGVFF